MKVLITGNQGYLGTVMSPIVRDGGHQVHGLDSGLFAECVLGTEPEDAATTAVDVRDVQPEHLAGFDAVIHLAALSNDPLGALAPEITHDINHHASVRLARLAKEAGVARFLYASTCSVYGASGGDTLVDESAALDPLTPYAVSKVNVEAELMRLADDDFTPTSLRNATAFGFSPRLRADIVVNNLVGSAVLTGEVLVLSDGTPWRPLVHAEDIARAFLATLDAPRESVHAKAFNVGAPENNVTVAQIADIVADVTGAQVRITGQFGGDPRSYRVDFTAIGEALPGYKAEWDVRRGAQQLFEHYRSDGLTAPDFADRFTRLAWLKSLQDNGRVDGVLRPTAGGSVGPAAP